MTDALGTNSSLHCSAVYLILHSSLSHTRICLFWTHHCLICSPVACRPRMFFFCFSLRIQLFFCFKIDLQPCSCSSFHVSLHLLLLLSIHLTPFYFVLHTFSVSTVWEEVWCSSACDACRRVEEEEVGVSQSNCGCRMWGCPMVSFFRGRGSRQHRRDSSVGNTESSPSLPLPPRLLIFSTSIAAPVFYSILFAPDFVLSCSFPPIVLRSLAFLSSSFHALRCRWIIQTVLHCRFSPLLFFPLIFSPSASSPFPPL